MRIVSKAADLLKFARSESFSFFVIDALMPGLVETELVKLVTRKDGERRPIIIMPSVEVFIQSVLESDKQVDWSDLLAATLVQREVSAGGGVSRSRSRAVPATADAEAEVRHRVLEASFRERERLLDDSLTTSEVASLLGVTRQTPHDRAKQKTLLAIEDKNQLRFPRWQFDADGPSGVVSGLPEVLRALAIGPLAQARWLTRANRTFGGRTPLQAIKAGDLETVVQEAYGVGAQAGSAHG
jgi:hypothetical protein